MSEVAIRLLDEKFACKLVVFVYHCTPTEIGGTCLCVRMYTSVCMTCVVCACVCVCVCLYKHHPYVSHKCA